MGQGAQGEWYPRRLNSGHFASGCEQGIRRLVYGINKGGCEQQIETISTAYLPTNFWSPVGKPAL